MSPRVTTEKGGTFVAFKVLVHSWSTTCAAISSHHGSLVLLNLSSLENPTNSSLENPTKFLLITVSEISSTGSLSAVIIIDN